MFDEVKRMNRRSVLLLATAAIFLPLGTRAQQRMQVKLYKDPNCPCCEGHAAYLNNNGFAVEIIPTADLLAKFADAKVPSQLNGVISSRWMDIS